jgi:hypothetical protein
MAKIEIDVPDENDDGDPIEIDNGDVMALIALLEYGRRRGFRFGPVIKIGSVELQAVDLRDNKKEARSDVDPWAAAGYEEK